MSFLIIIIIIIIITITIIIDLRGWSGETVKHVLYNLLVLVQIVFLCISAPFLCSCTLYAVLCKVHYN